MRAIIAAPGSSVRAADGRDETTWAVSVICVASRHRVVQRALPATGRARLAVAESAGLQARLPARRQVGDQPVHQLLELVPLGSCQHLEGGGDGFLALPHRSRGTTLSRRRQTQSTLTRVRRSRARHETGPDQPVDEPRRTRAGQPQDAASQ